MNNVVSVYEDNKSFKQNLLIGQNAEDIFNKMFMQLFRNGYKIHKWDHNTPEGKEMEQKGVDYTITWPSGFELHIQCKSTLVLGLKKPGKPSNYVTLEWMKYVNTAFPQPGRFLKGETAHRWLFMNKWNLDVVYFDYPKHQNYMINTIHKKYAGKFFSNDKQSEGTNLLCRMDLDDELFKGRYTYLKHENGIWTPIKHQWKYDSKYVLEK
jgi:hypothetical protein